MTKDALSLAGLRWKVERLLCDIASLRSKDRLFPTGSHKGLCFDTVLASIGLKQRRASGALLLLPSSILSSAASLAKLPLLPVLKSLNIPKLPPASIKMLSMSLSPDDEVRLGARYRHSPVELRGAMLSAASLARGAR